MGKGKMMMIDDGDDDGVEEEEAEDWLYGTYSDDDNDYDDDW